MQFEAEIVVFVAGVFAVLAIFISKLSALCGKDKPKSSRSVYECGIENSKPQSSYINQNVGVVVMSIILELICILLSLCCILNVADETWRGNIFLRFLLVVLFLSIVLSYQTTSRKNF